MVVHYWADLQSVHGFRCYDNTASNAKCQRVLVLALRMICKCTAVRTYVTAYERARNTTTCLD